MEFAVMDDAERLNCTNQMSWAAPWLIRLVTCYKGAILYTSETEMWKLEKKERQDKMKASPGSDILFIFVRTDSSPFRADKQTLCRRFNVCTSLSPPRAKTFPPFGLWCNAPPLRLSPSRPDSQSSGGHPLCIPFFLAFPKKQKTKVLRPSSHAILLPHFGFSLLIPEWPQPPFPVRELFFLVFFCSFPLFTTSLSLSPPFHYWPRIFLNSPIWITPLCLTLVNG